MCGLWAYFLRSGRLFDEKDYTYHEPWKHSPANRGPDRCVEACGSDYHLCFHRLAIHDLHPEGDQPFFFEWDDGTVIHLMCNGEIYNYQTLIEKYNLSRKMVSRSDCEVIVHLMQLFDCDIKRVCTELEGEFAFVARVERMNGRVDIYAARDMFGVRPLYIGDTSKGIIFSSMLAGIVGIDETAQGRHLRPGHFYHECQSSQTDIVYEQFAPSLNAIVSSTSTLTKMTTYKNITDALINAVRTRLSSEREIGFLLSGGLDSSLVVAIAVSILKVPNVRTFTIGFEKDAPDLLYARKVAAYLGTKHTEVVVSMDDAVNELVDVIKAIETYDITTIRASTPQYLIARYISENTNVRVIMNGDGSDEVACGYLYNFFAPSVDEAHEDAIRLLSEIHMYDGLRVDRTLGAHGLEARVPFLDPKYVQAYLNAPKEWRCPSKENSRMEKHLLREAFATLYPGILPDEILWRQKDAFSDAVSTKTKSWYEIVQKKVNTFITNKDFEKHKDKFKWIPPVSKESYYYRTIFERFFGDSSCSSILQHYWLPKWSGGSTEPSARSLSVYQSH